ncbi:MAG TPA: hypothetical protein HA260_07950, partial [Thermoplasmata archaeon]|nr:hypothetical protein [Thermoplasmata archaeon]
MKKTLVAFLVVVVLSDTSLMIFPAQGQPSDGAVMSSDDGTIIEMINQIDESLLSTYHSGLLNFAPRYTGSITCNLAAEYIYSEFQQMGLETEFHEWRYGGDHSKNVVATPQGADEESNGEYILCGHY